MKLSETNLYSISIKEVRTKEMYIRVPKEYENSYELSNFIENAVFNEEIDISDAIGYSNEIEDVSVSSCDSNFINETMVLIPNCSPRMFGERYTDIDFTITDIDYAEKVIPK